MSSHLLIRTHETFMGPDGQLVAVSNSSLRYLSFKHRLSNGRNVVYHLYHRLQWMCCATVWANWGLKMAIILQRTFLNTFLWVDSLLFISLKFVPGGLIDNWRGVLMFSLICAWINSWVNNREAGDLRRHRAHYDVIVMNGELIKPPMKLENGWAITSQVKL